MTDTIETLKAAAAELTARVAAFEKARVEEDEPPNLTEAQMHSLNKGTASASTDVDAARRLHYCERELARLREGLKVQCGEVSLSTLAVILDKHPWFQTTDKSMAREIQRHRALLKDGSGE